MNSTTDQTGGGDRPAAVSEPDTPQPAPVDDLREALYDVADPELGINIIDLGLVYGVTRQGDTVTIDMTLTSPGCPLSPLIESQIQAVMKPLDHQVVIHWVWVPPWGPQRITTEGRDQLRALGFNV